MRGERGLAVAVAALVGILEGCSGFGTGEEVLQAFPVTGLEGVVADSAVTFDPDVTSDGNGSLRLDAADSTRVLLYEVGAVDIEAATLIYAAHLRAEGVEGAAYLEMHVRFPERGEYLARSAASPLTATTAWTRRMTGYVLQEGERPDRVRLNLVLAGRGSVWIDDIRLIKGKMP